MLMQEHDQKTGGVKKDQKYKNTLIENINNYFKYNNISTENYPKFNDLFPTGHQKIIQVLISDFVKSHNIKLYLKKRIIMKSTYNDLNKIISFLGFAYQKDFIDFLQNSNSELFNLCDKKAFIDGIKKKIDELKVQIKI